MTVRQSKYPAPKIRDRHHHMWMPRGKMQSRGFVLRHPAESSSGLFAERHPHLALVIGRRISTRGSDNRPPHPRSTLQRHSRIDCAQLIRRPPHHLPLTHRRHHIPPRISPPKHPKPVDAGRSHRRSRHSTTARNQQPSGPHGVWTGRSLPEL